LNPNEGIDLDKNNLSLSFELIFLMDWVLRKNKDKVSRFVREIAQESFVREYVLATEADCNRVKGHAHEIVLGFVKLLEQSIAGNLEGKRADEEIRDNVLPAIHHIDHGPMDMRTIWQSVQQMKALLALDKMETDRGGAGVIAHDKETLKRALFSNIMKNWNPRTDDSVH
jgi:hypothetical protein